MVNRFRRISMIGSLAVVTTITVGCGPTPVHRSDFSVNAGGRQISTMKTQTVIVVAALWLARISALLLFLFWGAFFLEHLQEWFLRQDGRLPPLAVWMGQLLHLAMLVGLGLIVFRPAWGAIVTVVGTVLFFSSIGYEGFPYIALLNLPPVVFAAVHTAMRQTQRAEPSAAPNGGPAAPVGDSHVPDGPTSVS